MQGVFILIRALFSSLQQHIGLTEHFVPCPLQEDLHALQVSP